MLHIRNRALFSHVSEVNKLQCLYSHTNHFPSVEAYRDVGKLRVLWSFAHLPKEDTESYQHHNMVFQFPCNVNPPCFLLSIFKSTMHVVIFFSVFFKRLKASHANLGVTRNMRVIFPRINFYLWISTTDFQIRACLHILKNVYPPGKCYRKLFHTLIILVISCLHLNIANHSLESIKILIIHSRYSNMFVDTNHYHHFVQNIVELG